MNAFNGTDVGNPRPYTSASNDLVAPTSNVETPEWSGYWRCFDADEDVARPKNIAPLGPPTANPHVRNSYAALDDPGHDVALCK